MDALTSPLLRRHHWEWPQTPVTAAETTALVALARARGARTVAIGSGRTAVALDAARALAEAWGRDQVALEITWPETAASWLRHATRFAAADADRWIMLGPPLGWAQMTRHLLWSTAWKPAQTLLAGVVSERDALDLVGPHNLSGIAGVASAGRAWRLDADGHIVVGTEPES